MRILITGGSGFVGSNLCRLFKAHYEDVDVVAFDNLRRRGSELNLPWLKELDVTFVHGDIRQRQDLEDLDGTYDVIIEASAEPSVHAGTGGQSPAYVLDTNLGGTLNCLEFARRRCGGMVYLSTSRVYGIPALQSIRLRETQTRFEALSDGQPDGFVDGGVNEEFAAGTGGFRSLYGSTKLASELFIEEYSALYDFPSVVNRCGVIAGAGQFGKTDQGVFTLWVARHVFGGALKYTGFGGAGKQVRDLVHPEDLFRLIARQISSLGQIEQRLFCVGGGLDGSVSLLEYTRLCESVTGKRIDIASDPNTAAVDVPYHVSNCQRVADVFGWRPEITPAGIVQDIHRWLVSDEPVLKSLFA